MELQARPYASTSGYNTESRPRRGGVLTSIPEQIDFQNLAVGADPNRAMTIGAKHRHAAKRFQVTADDSILSHGTTRRGPMKSEA